jgi:hypothetical protein
VESHDSVRDDLATVAALGLLAYLCADVTHHVLGHAVACLAEGGRVTSLSSTYVGCTRHGVAIDLAGPLANLVVGGVGLAALRWVRAPAPRLFFALLAAFNLMWLTLQAAVSAGDDWAWPLVRYNLDDGPVRYALIVVGIVAYLAVIVVSARGFAPFARPKRRAMRIAVIAWLVAGALASVTCAFAPYPLDAIRDRGIPQSLGLAFGLLLVPARASRREVGAAVPIARSIGWIAVAVIAAIASVAVLGFGLGSAS